MKGISVKRIRNSIEQNLFTCKTCIITFKNFSSLSLHKSEHTAISPRTSPALLLIGNSTRNNSLAQEVLLCEDVTLDDPSLVVCEEASEKVQVVSMNKKDVEIVRQPSMKRSPSKELRKCTECDFNCYGEIPFKKHYDSVHRQCTLFQCAICEFEATSLPLLNAHMQAKHTDKERDTHLCNKCEKSFPYRFLLENHICFKCNKCSFIGNSSIAIASHVQANHEKVSVQIETNIRFQCELCDYTYKYNIQIKKHRQAAHNSTDTNEEFPCEECNLSFGNSKYLEEHVQSYHHNTAVPCSYCGIPLDKK